MALDFTELNRLKQAVLSGETILKINSHIKYEDLKIFNSLSDEQKSKLIWLDLSRSDISNSELPDFSKCVSLERLNLSYNNISDMKKIKGLNKLKNLTFLNLDYNFKIKRIENINGLINLTYLCLNGNKISEIENIDKLPNLTHLYLSNNKIEKLTMLNKLKTLTRLEIVKNKLDMIEEAKTIRMLDKNINLYI